MSDFYQPSPQRELACFAPAAVAVFLGYRALSGGSLIFLGATGSGFLASAILCSLAAAMWVVAVYQARKLVRHLPDVSFEGDELVVARIPFTRRIRWDEIAAVSKPLTTSVGFERRMASITITTKDGQKLRLLPSYRDVTSDEFRHFLIDRWRAGTATP